MEISKLSGSELVSEANVTVQDFWAWAYSDILSNRNRSVFAEFLVAVALNLTHQPRIEWDAVDLTYGDKKIEVKSSAYVQSWQQRKLSKINFDIAKKRGWDSKENVMADQESRSADCYIFCVYEEQDTQKVNILNLDKWSFIVVATEKLNEVFGNQKSVSLNRLQPLGQAVNYGDLKREIDLVLGVKNGTV
ncbi:MAG: hypothetical protein EA366_03910 [Spirulina sp. DLM2.Bin59]|nr:MAG: hypothetical protein EA366_03910 [Spirulina sp. DLM2.Bin59]